MVFGPVFCPLAVAVIGVLKGVGLVAVGVEGAGGGGGGGRWMREGGGGIVTDGGVVIEQSKYKCT